MLNVDADGPQREQTMRHVMGISGGKDSSALAIYMRDRVPEMEYFFCDTGSELPETYEFLQRLETALGKPIARLTPPSTRAAFTARSSGRRGSFLSIRGIGPSLIVWWRRGGRRG